MTDLSKKERLKALSKELLPLTGLYGLYNHPKVGKDITLLECSPTRPFDDSAVLFKIRCKELREYCVIINPTEKTIKNSLVIGHDDYKGAYLSVFNAQVREAKTRDYKEIFLDAWYQENPFEYKIDGKVVDLIDWNGHEVWGKYGFVMSEDERKDVFVAQMRDNKKTEDYIHELYLETDEAEEAKKIWAGLKLCWEGVFDLRDNSLSHQLLQGLNGKYGRYSKYAKTL